MENLDFVLNSQELKEAFMNPQIVVDNNRDIEILNSSVVVPMVICDNPDSELKPVPLQLNFILPKSLRHPTDPYAENIKKDLNLYRKLYEKYSNRVNQIIFKTKESIKNLYQPLMKISKDTKEYITNIENSINQLIVPLENQKNGLDDINYNEYHTKKKKEFLKYKEELGKKVDDFIKDAEEFLKKYQKLNKNTINDIDIFVQKFMLLAVPAKDLSAFMAKFFKIFEKSNECFYDLNDRAKVSEALDKIKQPINEFDVKTKMTEEILKEIERLEKEKKVENILDVKEKIKSLMKELEKKSKDISEEISKIRIIFDKQKKKLKKMEMKDIEIKSIDFQEATKKLENENKEIGLQYELNSKNMEEDINNVAMQTRLDLLFIMDITSSMDVYLQQIKTGIYEMLNVIKNECAGVDIYLGFIGYRDFSDLDFGDEYINLNFTNDYKDIINKISEVKAEGGGDTPEDLCGAFEFAKQKDWKGKTRFAILVTDSPCHGKKYHDLNANNEDEYPDGDRLGRNIEDYIKYFSENEISLYCLKINSTTEKMFKIFRDIYDRNIKDDARNQFFVGKAKKLFDFVTENAIKVFRNRKVLNI